MVFRYSILGVRYLAYFSSPLVFIMSSYLDRLFLLNLIASDNDSGSILFPDCEQNSLYDADFLSQWAKINSPCPCLPLAFTCLLQEMYNAWTKIVNPVMYTMQWENNPNELKSRSVTSIWSSRFMTSSTVFGKMLFDTVSEVNSDRISCLFSVKLSSTTFRLPPPQETLSALNKYI